MARVNVDALDEILNQEIPVLDKGFIRVIDYMGDDTAIVQAARVSYGKGTKSNRQDESLIRFLMQNKHTSPFEMCEIKFHVKLPLFVARQWLRHRTANVNEYSARYSIFKDEFYEPDRLCKQDELNKQVSSGDIDSEEAVLIKEKINNINSYCLAEYNDLIERGLARETARIIVPTSVYTEFYWKIDLHNLLHFIKLRNSPHAQYEIREYAKVLHRIIKLWVPFTSKAFRDFELNSITLSVEGQRVVKSMLKGKPMPREQTTLSKREYDNLFNWMESEKPKKNINKPKKNKLIKSI